MYNAMEALAGAGLLPLPHKPTETGNKCDANETLASSSESSLISPVLNDNSIIINEEEKVVDEDIIKLTHYPTLDQLQSYIEEKPEEAPNIIKPPSIEPLKYFLKKRAATIEGLKHLRARVAKHVLNCRISNTVGNSASIIGGILCFVFPPVGVPFLLAGSATTLGTVVTENVIEQRLRARCTEMLKEDSLAMKVCESNLHNITTWLVTVYSLGFSVSKAGVNIMKLSEAVKTAATLGTWAELIGQLPSLGNALSTGAKTAGTISSKILGISVIISVADLIQTWISKNATLALIDQDIVLLEQQLNELRYIVGIFQA